MRTRLLIVAALVALMAGPALADRGDQRDNRRGEAKAQVDFGIRVAQKSLWKEAVYRFEKAIELDPSYGGAWNNLGIAYEQMGRFDEARKAYEKALALEPSNTFIRNNYDLFREIYDRQNRRRDK
jgi:Flp pilus assembly protein TadD